MEKLIKNPTFLMIGAGVLAFAITNMIMNRKSKVTAQNEFSNFLEQIVNVAMVFMVIVRQETANLVVVKWGSMKNNTTSMDV